MPRVAFLLLFLSLDIAAADEKAVDVPVAKLGTQFRLTGRLHIPLGEVVKVQGVVVEGPFKGIEGGPNLRVQRINGRATQEDIQICVSPYFGEFGKTVYDGSGLPKLKNGKTYEFEGFETGGYTGTPSDAYEKAGLAIQTVGYYFRTQLEVYKTKQIDEIHFSPQDFFGREALIEGEAVSLKGKAYIVGNDWRLLTDANAPWPKDSEHKLAEAYGEIKQGDHPNDYLLERGITRLARLEDQLGKKVELRGTVWSMNGHWWFEYRGTDLYVENLEKTPGFEGRLHGNPAAFSGILEEAMLPAIDQITLKSDRDLRKYFVVKRAVCKPLNTLLSVERVRNPE